MRPTRCPTARLPPRSADEAAYSEALADGGSSLVVCRFTAEWSRQCQKMAPALKELVAARPATKFCQVDVDECEELSTELGVKEMPTFLFYRKGELLGTVGGADAEAVRAAVELYEGGASNSYEALQTLTVLDVPNASGASSTLGAFRAGRPLLIDFWTTRCVKCPAALSHLDAEALKHPAVTFASCALSLGLADQGTQAQVLELCRGQWANLSHLYMSVEEKEKAKKQFGFKAVPFCVAFAADGKVLYTGDPAKLDFGAVFGGGEPSPTAAPTAAPSGAPTAAPTAAPPATPPVEAAARLAECRVATTPLTEQTNRAAVPKDLPMVLGFGGDDDDF